ncbi:MAG: hypothetical protein IJL92_06030 [Thermoguttaceae bacterium]|nr:hypothetical protein [Thermoguttaceae bacterium]
MKTLILTLATSLVMTTGLCAAQDAPQDPSQKEEQTAGASIWNPKEQSKAFVLLAWGAPVDGEPLRRQCADGERRKLEAAFERVRETSRNRVVVRSLLDENAAHVKVREECHRISREAGPNDALLVYLFTPSATLIGDDGLYRNGLAPLAKSTLNPEPMKYGIMRKTLRDALAIKPHRLEALLVDVAPTFVLTTPYRAFDVDSDANRDVVKDDKLTYLTRFLLEGSGTLDVSSARPHRDNNPYEEPIAWVPFEWSAVNASDEIARRSVDDRLSGSIFCNALLTVAETRDFSESDLTVTEFVSKLERAMQERQQQAWKVFFAPREQTLTKFGRKGSEILVKPAEQ